jgi:hypothetical protein
MTNRKNWPAMLALALGMVIAGCDNDTEPTDLSVSTKLWELGEDGFIQFYTNDPQYNSYEFWRLYENTNDSDTYQIECKKVSGYVGMLYGMLFAASDSGSPSQYQYYLAGIDGNGYYRVDKRIGDKWEELQGWTSSDKLYTGYDKVNSIKASKTETQYTVFLNGVQVFQFNADENITGDRIGYYCSVGSAANENFPNAPVDVRFRQK